MIKVNDRFEIVRTAHDWVLVEKSTSINKKTGDPVKNTKNRYYPNIEQCLKEVIEQCLDSEEAMELMHFSERLEEVLAEIKEAVSLAEPELKKAS